MRRKRSAGGANAHAGHCFHADNHLLLHHKVTNNIRYMIYLHLLFYMADVSWRLLYDD